MRVERGARFGALYTRDRVLVLRILAPVWLTVQIRRAARPLALDGRFSLDDFRHR